MRNERVLSLMNRAVRVALSTLPAPYQHSYTLSTMEQDLSDPVSPTLVPVKELADRFAQMERLLDDLSLRIPVPPSPQEHVAPVLQPPIDFSLLLRIDPCGNLIPNKRYKTVLSESTYRLYDQTAALQPDQMASLSSTASHPTSS